MRILLLFAALCVALTAPCEGVQVLKNTGFEDGLVGGVPKDWTNAAWTNYSCAGHAPSLWQLYSTGLNNYPPLDVYAGSYSLGTFRVDGDRCPPVDTSKLEFFEYNVLYQNIQVTPNTTYRVKASAAVFVHHDRADDLEDIWGAGINLRICPNADNFLDSANTIWSHSFWNWEGDSFWRYYPELKNQAYHNAPNTFTTGSTQTWVTFAIIWLTKWTVDMDLCAIDNVELDLTTSGPAPPGSENFTAKNPPTWTNPDPIWAPSQVPAHWSKAGATAGGDQFYQSQECTVGLFPVSSAAADFNGDGMTDLAVACEYGHLISVYLQQPDGSFALKSHLPGTIYPRRILAGQIVGSPAADLIVSSGGKREVAVFAGVGDGSFAAPIAVAVNGSPWGLATGDFNADTKTDFAVACQQPGSVGGTLITFLGNGLGGFTQAQSQPTFATPTDMIASDFGSPERELDGIPDLAVLSWDGPVATYTGNGDGTFTWQAEASSLGGWKSTQFAMANFDEDTNGIPDLAVPYMWGPGDNADHVGFLTGVGDGTFQPQGSWEDWLWVSRFPSGVVGFDYNKDGHPDLAASNYSSSNAQVYKNLGSSLANYRFENQGRFGVGDTNTSIAAADVNSDTYTDLIITSGATQTVNVIYGGPFGEIYAPNDDPGFAARSAAVANFITGDPRLDVAIGSSTVQVFRNDGGMRFTQVYTNDINGTCADMRTADFNSDGKADVVALRSGSTGPSWAYVYLGDGAGGFSRKNVQMSAASAAKAQGLAVANFDGVNGPDLVTAESQSTYEGVYCCLNQGNGTFGIFKRTNLPSGSGAVDVAAGDFNGDGKQDVVVAMSALNQFALLTGLGTGFFSAPVYFNTGTEPTGIVAADFNADGKLDVVVSNKRNDTVGIFLGNGAGSFGAATNISVGWKPTHMDVFDLNADGKLDLVVSNSGDQTFCHLRGNGDGTFQGPFFYRTGSPPNRFAAGDLRGIGLPDLFAAANRWEIFRNALLSTGNISVADDGATQSYTDHINGAWSATTAGGRSIIRYRWAVSTSPNTSGIIPGGGWLYTAATSGTRSVSLTPGQTYYILAQAQDSASLWTTVGAADGILVQTAIPVSTAAEAKRKSDGQAVVLSGAVVSRIWGGSPWVAYVQDANRASGIRVEGTGTAPAAGNRVTVNGVLSSYGPERMLVGTASVTGNPGEPSALAGNTRSLGGAGFEYNPGPPVSGQQGVAGGTGTNNIGLLVRIAGGVTRSQQGEDFFYVDDGAALDDGSGLAPGVQCIASGLTKPSAGSYVVVTGASGAISIGGQTQRCLRVQRQGDILPVP